eukprot:s491_g2.t1
MDVDLPVNWKPFKHLAFKWQWTWMSRRREAFQAHGFQIGLEACPNCTHMAPRSKAKATPKKRAAKAPAQPKRLTSRKQVQAPAGEAPPETTPSVSEADASKAGEKKEANLGTFDASRLLTALKYQLVSKKASQSHKDAAQKLLEDYKKGDFKTKWDILESLTQKGFQDLSWTHCRSESGSKREAEKSEVLSGMMTRAKILELNGYNDQQMDDEEADELLEDLLLESESLYKHKRNKVPHKNSKLRRWYHKYNVGSTGSIEYAKEDRMETYAEGKSQKFQKTLEEGNESADSSSSGTFKTWSAMTAVLKKLKTQLQTLEDQVLMAEKQMETSQHEDVDVRKTVLKKAKEKLQDALRELRVHLMESTTQHKRMDDCTESIQARENLKQRVEDAKAECAAEIELSSPAKRLRSELVDLFLFNSASSSRVAGLANAADEAGVDGMQDLAYRCREDSTNNARDITRMANRSKQWPKLYEITMRVRNISKEACRGCWAADYIALRESAGLALPGADPSPMLPAPEKNGMGWSSRYLTSQEMNAFIKKLFQSSNIDTEGRRFSTHSCKATAISWCSKYDVGPEQRAVLARHFTSVQGPTALYSRDLLTAALRSFIRVLEAIRTEIFFPDRSRSGMLTPVPLGATVANSKAVPVTPLPEAVVEAGGLREKMDLKPMEQQPESVVPSPESPLPETPKSWEVAGDTTEPDASNGKVEWPVCELDDFENVEEPEAAPAKQGHQ